MLGEGEAALVHLHFNYRYRVGGKLEETEIRPMRDLEVRAASFSKNSSGGSEIPVLPEVTFRMVSITSGFKIMTKKSPLFYLYYIGFNLHYSKLFR